MRIGFGYDVHRLMSGRKLYIGGVWIPGSEGLDGHSDADVLLHAICDSLLGALGEGDIGKHFPDTDVQWKGVSSLHLLQKVVDRVYARGYRVMNIDSSVVAEYPRLSPHIPQMVENIATVLRISPQQVNVKATTSEGLGFVGKKEGMIAFAVALLQAL